MAFKKKNIYEIFGAALVLSALLSTASAVDCLGKSFHCFNSTHFMICVDVGGGVSQSIDDFMIPCPPPTVCQGNNHFECEFPTTSTPSTSHVMSESMPWEEVEVTTVSPPQNTTKEYSEKYMNTESITSLSPNATVDYTTEAASLINDVSITETRTAVTQTPLYDTTASQDVKTQTITEHNVVSAGELLTETANNYTVEPPITNDAGLVSTTTKKAIPSKFNTTETTSLIDDISMSETGPVVTEALPYDTTTNEDVITQTITEHNVVSTGELLTEAANNYTVEQPISNEAGLVSTTTKKAIPTKLNTTETASLIDDISMTETGPAVTEALPYDISTNEDVITQTITEHNVVSAGELLTETANNYTVEQPTTNESGLVSTSTNKAIPSKLNTTEATLLIDDISMTETGPAVTEALPYDITTNEDVITQTITEHNVVSGRELLTETAKNYTVEQPTTNESGLVSTSTNKAIPSKLNTTEATLLIDDISMTETGPVVTEALPYDITTNEDVITQTITELNVVSGGELLTETANNYTVEQPTTNESGLVSTSTNKAITSKLNTTEAALLIDDISMTETVDLAVTEALPYDTTTSQDVITQTITEHNVVSVGELLTETANNYTVEQSITNEALVSTTTKKAIPSKLNTTETASLIDDISMTETGPAVTEALPYDITTNEDVITQIITEHNVVSAGELFSETDNNYTLEQQKTKDAVLVSTSTKKTISSKLNTTETATFIDDTSMADTVLAVSEALPYDTTSSQGVKTQTINEHNLASEGELLTETTNNYTIVQPITNDAGLVSTSTNKGTPSKLNTTEPVLLVDDLSITETGPAVTEALPYYTTTSKDVTTETITDYTVAVTGGLSTETAHSYKLVQEIKINDGLVSTSTETTLPGIFNKSFTTDIPIKLTTKPVKVDIRKTINVTSAFNQVKTTSESIPTEISVVNELPTTTGVFATDANLMNTNRSASTVDMFSNTNMLDYRPTTESELAIITTDVNIILTKQPAEADVLQSTLITNSLNYATTTSESKTVENVGLPKRNLTVFGKGAVTDTNANLGIEISLAQEHNMKNHKQISTKNISSESSSTKQIIVDMFKNRISIDVPSISTTETVHQITNDTWSTKNAEVLDQTKQMRNSMVTEASVGTELPTTVYASIPDGSTVSSVDMVQNAENKNLLSYTTSSTSTVFEENIVTATTNWVTESPLFLKQNPTDDASVNQISINTGLGSFSTEQAVIPTLDYSINPKNFARGTEIVTTDETKHNVLDQETLGPDSIVAKTDIGTELPTSIDDKFTTETNVMKKNEVPSADNALLITNLSNHTITTDTVILDKNMDAELKHSTNLEEDSVSKTTQMPVHSKTKIIENVSSHSNSTFEIIISQVITSSTDQPAAEYSVTTDKGIYKFDDNVLMSENSGYLIEAPQIFATNINDNIPKIVVQTASTRNIDIEENFATAANDTFIAKKKILASVKNLGNSPKRQELVEYNATEPQKTIIIAENLLLDNFYIQTEKITTPASDTENNINDSLLDNFRKSTENSFVQHNVSTEQPTFKEIQDSITTDMVLETEQATSEAKNNQKQILVMDTGSVLASTQQIFDKTSNLDVESGTLLGDTFNNTSHTMPSVINQINKVEAADSNHLDIPASGITEDPYYFIHGDTTRPAFNVKTPLAAGVESNNKIENQISNSEVILDVNKNIVHAETIRPTDAIYNAQNPINNIIFNTNVEQSDVNEVETTIEANIALTSGLSQEKNLNPIQNQAKEYIQKVVDSFVMKEKTTESNLKETETSFHETVTTNNTNFGALPMNTKLDDSGITTTLNSHGIMSEIENTKDLFIAEDKEQLDTNLSPTTLVNDRNEATLNNNQFNYLTHTSLNDNIKNKIDLDTHIAAKPEDRTSTLNPTNDNKNVNNSQGIIINTTNNKNIMAQIESTNGLNETVFKIDLSESEKINRYNTLQSVASEQDMQNHNLPTETYIRLDVDNYPKLTIMKENFSPIYEPTQIPSQINNFMTTANIFNNDANIITEKTTSVISVDLNEANIVNGNIYLQQLDKTLQTPVITDKQKSYFNTGNQDDNAITTNGATKFAPADVNVASNQISNQAKDLSEKTIGRKVQTETGSPYVTQFEATTAHIKDANQNKIDEVPSALKTRNSTPKFTQFDGVQNEHTKATIESFIGDPSINVAKSSKAWESTSNTDNNIKWNTTESLLPKQDNIIILQTKKITDSSKPYPATSTSRTINAPNLAHEDNGINNALRTGVPVILVIKNKSIDNPLTQHQVDTEITADVNKINTSSSVTANAEPSHVSRITLTKSLTVSRNLSHPKVIDVIATSLIQDKNNNINNMQGNMESQDKTVANKAEVTQNKLLYKTRIKQANRTHDNSITTQNNNKNITSSVYRDSTSSIAKESMNVSRKKYTIVNTLLYQNHTNATKEVAKTQPNAISSQKAVNKVSSTTQVSAKRIALRPVSSMTENPIKQVLSYVPLKYNCINGTRARYSDKNDCRKFYICIGNNQPIVGTCPRNTVFSDIKKLCTRNMSHCIRENQFKCPSAGRFSDLINDVYYICVNYKNSLYRFKFQCQKGFSLDKTTTRCTENKEIMPMVSVLRRESSNASRNSKSSSTSSISSDSRGDSDSSNSSQSKRSGEKKETEKAEEPEKPDNKEEDDSAEIFVCRKEGKFPIHSECRRYYLCKKNRKSEYRRKIKKCESGDVFHKSKKKCVDAESYEC